MPYQHTFKSRPVDGKEDDRDQRKKNINNYRPTKCFEVIDKAKQAASHRMDSKK